MVINYYFHGLNSQTRRTMSLRLLLIIGLVSLTSCGTYKQQTTNRTPEEISQLDYFSPISYTHYIEKGNISNFSDSLSAITQSHLDSILNSNNKFRTARKINLNDSITKIKYEEELTFLVQQIMGKQKLESLHIPPTIDSIMKINNSDFGLATLSMGFGRKKGNYTGQLAKGIGIGILTLGMYTPAPIKSNLTIYSLIFDAKNENVAFYRQTPMKAASPTDPTVLNQQLEWIFDGYFY